jgi:hypothetical protein
MRPREGRAQPHDGGQTLDVVRRLQATTMGTEHVGNTVMLRNFLRGDGRGSVRPRSLLRELIAVICLIVLIAAAVIGGWFALFHWIAVSLPPSLLLSCPGVQGCAGPGHGEHLEVQHDSRIDVLHPVP